MSNLEPDSKLIEGTATPPPRLTTFLLQAKNIINKEWATSWQAFKTYMFSTKIEPDEGHLKMSQTAGTFANQEAAIQSLMAISHPAIKFTGLIVLAAFLFFGVWGTLAPLSSSVVAPGMIVLSEKTKSIQHLEGGIVDKIMIKDGDLVSKDQVLLEISNTSSGATVNRLRSQYLTNKAIESRLIAERDGAKILTMSPEVLQHAEDPAIQTVMATQAQIFATRSSALEGKISVYEQQIHQNEEQMKGYASQVNSYAKQMKLINEEIEAAQALLDKGLAARSRVSELRARAADLQGRHAQFQSEIASMRERITGAQIEIINERNNYVREASQELKEIQTHNTDLSQQLQAAEDVLRRTVISAPYAGIIKGLKYHTVGGVISPGDVILEIVPQDDHLLVEANVQPKDIEGIHPGMKARVNLSAYRSRLVPRVDGTVVYVSADIFQDNNPMNQGMPFYKVRVEVPQSSLENLTEKVVLYPGMPAEVFIVLSTRTFLQYLMSPITDSFHRAFIER